MRDKGVEAIMKGFLKKFSEKSKNGEILPKKCGIVENILKGVIYGNRKEDSS